MTGKSPSQACYLEYEQSKEPGAGMHRLHFSKKKIRYETDITAHMLSDTDILLLPATLLLFTSYARHLHHD